MKTRAAVNRRKHNQQHSNFMNANPCIPSTPNYGQWNPPTPVAQSVQPPRELEIPAAQDRLDSKIISLHGLLGTLEDRLKPALRVEPKNDSTGDKLTPMPNPTTVYDKLNAAGREVQFAVNRVQELLLLLEL